MFFICLATFRLLNKVFPQIVQVLSGTLTRTGVEEQFGSGSGGGVDSLVSTVLSYQNKNINEKCIVHNILDHTFP